MTTTMAVWDDDDEAQDTHELCPGCKRHWVLKGLVCPTCEASQDIMDPRIGGDYPEAA